MGQVSGCSSSDDILLVGQDKFKGAPVRYRTSMPYHVEAFQGGAQLFRHTFPTVDAAIRFTGENMHAWQWTRWRILREGEGVNPLFETLMDLVQHPAGYVPRSALVPGPNAHVGM